MNRRLLVVLVLVAIAVVTTAPAQVRIPRKSAAKIAPVLLPGDPAPAFVVTDIETGRPVEFRWDEATLTLVHFYANACDPCRISMPVVEHIWSTHRERGFRAVAVLMDVSSREQAAAFLDEVAATFPVARRGPDTPAVWGGVTLVPLTFLVGGDGKVVRKYVGADVDNVKALQEDVAAFLDGRPVSLPVLPGETKSVNTP